MKSILTSFLALAATTFVANARFIDSRTFRELDKKADLIVVAKPISTKDTPEQTILPHIGPAVHVVGLSSEFEVILVLKGDPSLKKLIVHHYRLADPAQRMGNAPMLASFDPKESKRYLLFLQHEADGRYAPFDQVDPAETSLLSLNGTEWDQMTLEDFKIWLNAKKWLDERSLPASAMSPQIPPSGRGEGSLHEAALNGKLEKAKALLKVNPNLVFNQRSSGSQTPLFLAVEYGHKDVAELLLANQAKVEAKGYGGWTPLLSAVFGGHKDLVELLLANQADVNGKEDSGRTPLHVAIENGYTDIAALLLASKADVNAANRTGHTPLHNAVSLGHKDLVELLLANKAEINAKDNCGKTPLGLAVFHNHQDLAEFLRLHGGRE